MTTLVHVFHPDLSQSTANKALADAARTVAGTQVRDLYALYPLGRIDVAAEQAALEAADRIVLQYPVYWYTFPPLLKTWLDEVLTYGWAYGSTGTALRGKQLVVAPSFGASKESYGPDRFGYTAEQLLAPLHATSNLIGTTWGEPFITFGATGIAAADLAAQQDAYRAFLED